MFFVDPLYIFPYVLHREILNVRTHSIFKIHLKRFMLLFGVLWH